MDHERLIKVLSMISKDMADDAKSFDGQPFNGRTIAQYFGHQGAAIAAIADILKHIIEESHNA
jgi:hypothetical protein